MRIYTSIQTLQVEEKSEEYGVDRLSLMENAGSAAAKIICECYNVSDARIAVVCGRGNNGGDGYVVARRLQEAGARVNIIMSEGMPTSKNALDMFCLTKTMEIPTIDYCNDPETAFTILNNSSIIVDGLFGTGFHGEMPEAVSKLANLMSKSDAKVIALDLPSGVICDSGEVAKNCIKAELTISFISLKPCHVLFPTAQYCGEVIVADIGIPNEAYVPTDWYTTTEEDILPLFGPRPADCHKGSFGNAYLICGSEGMAGAAYISAMAAVRCGAGLVTMVVPRSIYIPLATKLNEPIFMILPQNDIGTVSASGISVILANLNKATALLIGCGMGNNADTAYITEQVIARSKCPIVIDADGINVVSSRIDMLRAVTQPVIMTPHIGEMARLCNVTIDEILADKVAFGKKIASEYGVILVLKGAHTMIIEPNGNVFVNMSGNSGMATAGSGDMLAGMICSFLAQGMEPIWAARSAVYLHGKCGDFAAKHKSQRAMTPTDMLSELTSIFLKYE